MYSETVIQNITIILSTLLAVIWTRHVHNYLRPSQIRRYIAYDVPKLESPVCEPLPRHVSKQPAPTQSTASSGKSAPKRKTKRARGAAKKRYMAPTPQPAENIATVEFDEVPKIVPIQQCEYSSEDEVLPITSERYSSTSSSSDDENGTSLPVDAIDAGYFSNPTTSSSSQSSASDEESGFCYPVVINGTTYYSSAIINKLSACARLPLELMSECQIHGFISNYLKASMKELKENGYPFFKSMMSKTATINSTQYTAGNKLFVEKEERMRICCGCQKEFDLEKNLKKNEGTCQFHPKGKRFDKVRGCFIRNCCEEDDGLTAGCKKRPIHVFDQLYRSELDQFVQTEKPTGKDDPRSTKIYALDAEMVYTMAGPALARLSVIDWFGNSVLDVMVKPPTRVIDANTEYSGLTIKDVNAAKDTLGTCRRKFLQLINSDTILVGHSLESDLKALRLVHYNVADTSLIYKPSKNKIGLKTLALDYLGLAIQSNNKDQLGHDSEEDARVCLELLKLKIDNFV